MACEVKAFANIPDLKKVQELLGFSQDENWLNAVYYSISPTTEVIVFGHGSKLVILSSQWSSHTNQLTTFTITWKGELENENEIITSILCIPIYGSNNISDVDWTCIVVGLASGMALFYADSGMQIFSQRWHPEAIQSIKAQSSKMQEEIHIGYASCVCILQGSLLIPILKGLKQNLSKNLTSNNMRTNVQHPDTIACRKWEYKSKSSIINDFVTVGTQKQSTFNSYLEQSLDKGFYSKCRSSPSQNSLVIGVGVKPYVGFHYAKEGFVQTDLGDVAKAVANRVISSLPNLWIFGSSSSSSSKDKPVESEQQIMPGEPMVCRFGICDIQRQAFNIWLSPTNNLAVVSDNLSRVILIDCVRGVALRIWKGYRDAQCGFMRVKEKTLKNDRKEKRKSLFLIIYAPRRSCLEIWTLQNGPRVAAFSVSKNAQLIYNTHGIMGINPGNKTKYNPTPCLFLDPSDETLKEVQIPFHCALSDGNSNTAKDIHLLRRIKVLLRSAVSDNEIISEIEMLCNNIQTDEIRLQLIEMLSKNKKLQPIIFQRVIRTLKNLLDINDDCGKSLQEDIDYKRPRSRLALLLDNYEKLVNFYIALKETDSGKNANLNSIKLYLSENDLETIQKLIDLCQEQNMSNAHNNNKVTFVDKQCKDNFSEFISAFNVENPEIALNVNKKQLYGLIGEGLFSRFLVHGHDLCDLEEYSFLSEDLLILVIYYWLEMEFNYTTCKEVIEDMARLANIIQHICNSSVDQVTCDYSEISPLWQNIREILLESSSALRSLLAGVVCRNVANTIQKTEKDGAPKEDDDDVWEKVSHEAAQWSLIIGKLDDISVLGAILNSIVYSETILMPLIPYEKPDCSLKNVLCSGKGIVSELVSKWLTNSGIHPKQLDKDNDDSCKDPVMKHLNHLRIHFPFSLETGIVLCQMTWEFMSHWSKNLSKIEYLKAGLTCLDTYRADDLALKHGLCCMIWNAHLKIPLEATKKLIHKVGRLPKEKLCQQDIGISANLVSEFLDCCLEFLKHFETSLNHEKREIKFEEILQNDQIPLSFLALQQNHAIIEILNLHIELCKVLHLISFFSLKLTKPITHLFDAMANRTFFIEINRELNYQLPNSDLVLIKNREEFLCSAVSASMDLIREDLERVYVLEHAAYIKKIEELANMWNIDVNVIKKHQIVEMYAHNWDAYAEELLASIVEQESIGQSLLEIAGRRLNLYASNSPTIFCQVASIGPQLLKYLDNLKTKATGVQITAEYANEIELEPMTALSAKAFHCLSSKESKSLHIAGQLFDACSLLKKLEKKITTN